jgi:enoyl-CoA hydratase/carnithine racemase
MVATAHGNRIKVTRHTAAFWRVTFDHPPLNLFGPESSRELASVIEKLESDTEAKVVVFDSAVDGYFLNHYDFEAPPEQTTQLPDGATGLAFLPDLLVRLSKLPVVSIASIRGRATGVGSELALASDIRFASREKAFLSQWEIGAGLVTGGGPIARLSRLIGRGRTLEVILGGDDFDGELAERYGYVNRAVPDADLDEFVDAFAARIASFDRQTLGEAKHLVNESTLPDDADIAREWPAFWDSVNRPAAQARIGRLLERGLQQPGDLERRLNFHTAQLGSAGD